MQDHINREGVEKYEISDEDSIDEAGNLVELSPPKEGDHRVHPWDDAREATEEERFPVNRGAAGSNSGLVRRLGVGESERYRDADFELDEKRHGKKVGRTES